MPLRDDRRGRRATIGSGKPPLRPDFSSATTSTTSKPDAIAGDTSTPAPDADDVCHRDHIPDGRPFERAGNDSSGATEASSDAREAERNESLRISASAKTHAHAPSVKAYADAPSVEAHAYAPFARPHADAPSIKAPADTPSVEAHAKAPSLHAYADAPSLQAHADAPSVMAQPRSLLEPADVLMTMVRPLMRLGSAMIRFANLPIVRSSNVAPQEPAGEETRPAAIVERSFANEVASLLQAPMEVDPSPQRAPDASPPFGLAPAPPAPPDRAGSAATQPFASVANSSNEPPIEGPAHDSATSNSSNDTPRIDAPATANTRHDRVEGGEPAEGPTLRNGVCEARIGIAADNSTLGIDAWKSGPSEKRDGVVAGETSEHDIVARVPSRHERAVPITRLPLRPQGFDVTWTVDVPEFERAGPLSRTARHALLERLVRNPGSVSSDAIVCAYRQEEGEGRAIALRILLRNFPQAGRSAFVEALRVGSDEERALAVDGLTAIGAREEMASALCDRVDAIAAKAALSYVGTLERADYRVELSPFIDEARIEAILNLLAGIVE